MRTKLPSILAAGPFGRDLLVAALLLLVPLSALAQECEGLSLEGQCDGNTRRTCNAGKLITEECDTCCGWDGNGFDCLATCPDAGACIDECLDGVSVFGCSLQNTHEWTCEVGGDDCTKRLYVACAADEVCDEASTHKCTDASLVDLCGGIPDAGKCIGGLFEKCVTGAIQTTDCAGQGKPCVDGVGCTDDCPVACVPETTGCESDFEQWQCLPDAITGCDIKVAKNCGTKKCYQDKCRFQAEIDEIEAAAAAEVVVEVEVGTDVSPGEAQESSGCRASPTGIGETALITLSTVLGLFLVGGIARRRRDSDG